MTKTKVKQCSRDPEGPMMFGWCMTQDHDGCKGAYVDWNLEIRKCGCVRHDEPIEPNG
jgi:hypothetical protein